MSGCKWPGRRPEGSITGGRTGGSLEVVGGPERAFTGSIYSTTESRVAAISTAISSTVHEREVLILIHTALYPLKPPLSVLDRHQGL